MLRIAVIGAGHWGPNLIRNFHDGAHSKVVRIVDTRPERLQQLKARFPDIPLSAEVEPVWADKDIDAVVIATPTNTHFALTQKALQVGKHVLVEKPLADKVEDAETLTALATQVGKVLMVGHVFLFNPAVQRVKQMLVAGDLGRVYYISMVRTNLGPIRLDVNAAWDLAAHDISIADEWLGGKALSASAVGGAYINPGVQDAVFATLRYPGDVLVNLHASWLNPRKNRDVTVVGDRRMLTFDDMNLQEPIRVYDKGVTDQKVGGVVDTFASFRASVREGDISIPKVPMGEPLKSECEHFVDCVLNNKMPIANATKATAVVRTLDAIARSLAHGGREEKVG